MRQVATGSTGIRPSVAFLSPAAPVFLQIGMRARRDASRPSSGGAFATIPAQVGMQSNLKPSDHPGTPASYQQPIPHAQRC